MKKTNLKGSNIYNNEKKLLLRRTLLFKVIINSK